MNKFILFTTLLFMSQNLKASALFEKITCLPIVPCLGVEKDMDKFQARSRKPKKSELIPEWEDETFLDELFEIFSPKSNKKTASKRKRTPMTLWDDEAFIEDMMQQMEADKTLDYLQSPKSDKVILSDKFRNSLKSFSKQVLPENPSKKDLINHADALLSMMRGFIFASDEIIQDIFWSYSKSGRSHTNSWIADIKIFSSATGTVDSFRLVYNYLTDEEAGLRISSYVNKRIKAKMLKDPGIKGVKLYQLIEKNVFLCFIDQFQGIFTKIYPELASDEQLSIEESFFFHQKNWKLFKQKVYFPNLHRSSIRFISPWFQEIDETEKKIQNLDSSDKSD